MKTRSEIRGGVIATGIGSIAVSMAVLGCATPIPPDPERVKRYLPEHNHAMRFLPEPTWHMSDGDVFRPLVRAPVYYPVMFRLERIDLVISLDDCIDLSNEPFSDVGGDLGRVLEYYGTIREALPSTRVIDLGARSVADIRQFVVRALQRSLAHCIDRRSGRVVSEIKVRTEHVGDCTNFKFCLPDGEVLFSIGGSCAVGVAQILESF